MPTLHTHALLLRARDFGESDRIAQLLTPATGRISVVAKGARRSVKRAFGTLDLFNLLRVQIEQRRPQVLARLEQARLTRTWHGLREHPSRFALACYLLEMLNRLAPESGARAEHERLFRFATRALSWLDAAAPSAATRPLLEFRTLGALGLRPELARCVRCSTRIEPRDGPRVPYQIADGGPLCAACHSGVGVGGSRVGIGGGGVGDGDGGGDGARGRASGRVVAGGGGDGGRDDGDGRVVGVGGRVVVGGGRRAGGRGGDGGDFHAPPALHIGTMRALEASLKVPLAELPRLAFGTREVAEATHFLQRFLRFHVGLELRSERLLTQLPPRIGRRAPRVS